MGYIEGILILFLAFLVIGPKDFPKVMRQIGEMWKQIKNLTHSFYDHLEKIDYNHPQKGKSDFEEQPSKKSFKKDPQKKKERPPQPKKQPQRPLSKKRKKSGAL